MTTKTKIDQEYLEKACREFLWENYQIKLYIPIVINNRLSSTLGCFRWNKATKKPIRIEVAGHLIKNGTHEQVLDTLYHEAIHLACFMKGWQFRDGEDDFENELKKHGVSATNTFSVKRTLNIHIYKCDCETFERQRRMLGDLSNYYCVGCNSGIEYVGKKQVIR